MRPFGVALRLHRRARVFGVSSEGLRPSYVDRGGLDGRLRDALEADRHIAIHGGSLQGKSWLREQTMDSSRVILVQCLPHRDAASLLIEALGIIGVQADLQITEENAIVGTLTAETAIGIGNKYLSAKFGSRESQSVSERQTVQRAPVGQTPASIAWVAQHLRESGGRVVFEDFHHLSEAELRKMAFLLKALGEHGVYCVVVGIWPDDHFLVFYNGELFGRIDDIHLEWTGEELQRVVDRASTLLNVTLSAEIRSRLITDARGSVGLLRQLLEAICEAAQITRTCRRRQLLEDSDLLDRAQRTVWARLRPRFEPFTEQFAGQPSPAGRHRLYPVILQIVVEDADDSELLEGLEQQELLLRIRAVSHAEPDEITTALEGLHRYQQDMGISPIVLSYDRIQHRLFLADRSFLFYRDAGVVQWPWRS